MINIAIFFSISFSQISKISMYYTVENIITV
jgi:hypothetical protein